MCLKQVSNVLKGAGRALFLFGKSFFFFKDFIHVFDREKKRVHDWAQAGGAAGSAA